MITVRVHRSASGSEWSPWWLPGTSDPSACAPPAPAASKTSDHPTTRLGRVQTVEARVPAPARPPWSVAFAIDGLARSLALESDASDWPDRLQVGDAPVEPGGPRPLHIA